MKLRIERAASALLIIPSVFITCASLAACGGDDAGNNAGQGGSTAAVSGSSSSGTGGTGAGSGGTGASGGTGGSSGTGVPQDAGSDGATDSGTDAGNDAGPLMGCRAPVPNATVGNTCPSGAPVTLKATLVESGLGQPVYVTHAPGDGANRLFVLENTGSIRVLEDGNALPDAFLDLTVVYSGPTSEQGLLGMAFDPDYATNGRFFVSYTGPVGGFGYQSVVESYRVSSDPNKADATTKTPFLTVPDTRSNHNGGMIEFGPDGCLYIAMGDGGGGDDPDGNGQKLDTELGKILRMDADDATATAPGNLAGAAVPHIWDYGLRNPWRFSFDRETGDLYIGDVGQNAVEEVDVEPKGTGSKNYGWKLTEGNRCRDQIDDNNYPTSCAGTSIANVTPATHDYLQGNGDNCVIGGYVYRGGAIPSLRGYYLFGDNGSNRVRAFVWDGDSVCPAGVIDLTSQLTLSGKITSFGEDADGEIYITTSSGNLYRIEAN